MMANVELEANPTASTCCFHSYTEFVGFVLANFELFKR